MPQDAVKGLEQQKKDFQKLVNQRDLALKLSNNREFRALILEEYCVAESARLVHQSADPALPPLERADALNMAQAAGHLRRWLSMTIKMGDTAADQMADLDDAIEQARAEEDMPEDQEEGTLQ